VPAGIDPALAGWLLRPWSVAEVCAYLGCAPRTLRDWRADPGFGFPAPLRGRPLRWWPGDILAWQGLTVEQVAALAGVLAGLRPPAAGTGVPPSARSGRGEGGS
jgi:hypothetical protein